MTAKMKHAVELFHGREKYNCTQAILKAFQTESGISDDAVRAASQTGGGKTLEGTCGALHAAKILFDDPGLVRKVEAEFARTAGSTRCRQIRKLKRLSCRQCVSLSAELVQHHLSSLRPDDPEFRTGLMQRESEMLPAEKKSWWRRN